MKDVRIFRQVQRALMVRFWQFSAMMVPASNKYSYNAQAIDFFVDVRSRTNGANGKKSRVAGKGGFSASLSKLSPWIPIPLSIAP